MDKHWEVLMIIWTKVTAKAHFYKGRVRVGEVTLVNEKGSEILTAVVVTKGAALQFLRLHQDEIEKLAYAVGMREIVENFGEKLPDGPNECVLVTDSQFIAKGVLKEMFCQWDYGMTLEQYRALQSYVA